MSFPIHFLFCNIIISLLFGIFLLIKKGLKKHLTIDTQYRLWYVVVFALFLPFFPNNIFLSTEFAKLFLKQIPHNTAQAAGALSTGISADSNVFFYERYDVVTSSHTGILRILWIIWIAGMILAACYFLFGMIKVRIYEKNAYLVTMDTEPNLYRLYRACAEELNIKRQVRLYASCTLSSPISYGFVRPAVMIPQDLDIVLNEDEIRFIFLHELQHYKRKDMILNHLICLLQILYWFHPLIRYGFRQFRADREIACDHSVLRIIGRENCVRYGHTLLKYTGQMQHGHFVSTFSTTGDNNRTIRLRIMEIAAYREVSVIQKMISTGILCFWLILICCLSPFLTHTYASESASALLNDTNCQTIDVSSYFQGIAGSFVLYDTQTDEYRICNRELSVKRVSPDSTFKIYSGLFALEEHIISDDNSLLAWDGTDQPFSTWNYDQTLDSAMNHSVNWYFQRLDRELGISRLTQYYQKVSYGNCDLSGGTKTYWAESSLKISPFEQATLLADLLTNKWNFEEAHIQAIKDSLYQKDMNGGKLYGKTGSGMVDGKKTNGWFVGFFEKNGNIYCFALNLQNSASADGKTAANITMDILNHMF